jgi:hypothetical protein
MTNSTISIDLDLIRETTIVSLLLGLVLLVPNQEYGVLLALPYSIPFLLVLL